MNARRIGVLVGLDLRQRVRRPGFYVLLGIFFVVVCAIAWLGSLVFGEAGGGRGVASIALYGVLLMAVLVTPTFTGNAINGEREQATLAPVQVTLATTPEILAARFLAGWATGLVYLAAALPVVGFALLDDALWWGDGSAGCFGSGCPAAPVAAWGIAAAILVLAAEVGVIAAIGVGLSAIIAKPLFSVAATYLVVMMLVVGTLIAFALGTFAVRSPVATLTESPREVYVSDGQNAAYLPDCADAAEPCLEERPDVSDRCVAVRGAQEVPRYDRVWWLLAANPFVVVADATPTAYDRAGYPVDLFGQLKYGIRAAQQAPDLEQQDWSDPCDGRVQLPGEYVEYGADSPTAREVIEGSVPTWFVGLGLQALLAAGLLVWGGFRTRTPARRTPPGSRVA
ncbi:ABC transporter permease [Microbacterium excoecariae]|uniref:ABC transporter permease n=1 Tax=Microbacterium excoecariae TaxID=2715210 RepID=UPI00140CE797|nr:ABC transporter permease [Microbacterium excoecariae]NHI15939.1 ABC transporter permease [Microbacterium excoecariae]